MNNLHSWLVPAVALSLPLLAVAQQSSGPSDPKAAASALRYQSAFADYKPWQDVKPGNWRQLNDNVAPKPEASGGHAGHGSAQSPASAASAAAPAPAMKNHHQGGHGSHQMPGGKQ